VLVAQGLGSQEGSEGDLPICIAVYPLRAYRGLGAHACVSVSAGGGGGDEGIQQHRYFNDHGNGDGFVYTYANEPFGSYL
jgi:hypothetical protein